MVISRQSCQPKVLDIPYPRLNYIQSRREQKSKWRSVTEGGASEIHILSQRVIKEYRSEFGTVASASGYVAFGFRTFY